MHGRRERGAGVSFDPPWLGQIGNFSRKIGNKVGLQAKLLLFLVIHKHLMGFLPATHGNASVVLLVVPPWDNSSSGHHLHVLPAGTVDDGGVRELNWLLVVLTILESDAPCHPPGNLF